MPFSFSYGSKSRVLRPTVRCSCMLAVICCDVWCCAILCRIALVDSCRIMPTCKPFYTSCFFAHCFEGFHCFFLLNVCFTSPLCFLLQKPCEAAHEITSPGYNINICCTGLVKEGDILLKTGDYLLECPPALHCHCAKQDFGFEVRTMYA